MADDFSFDDYLRDTREAVAARKQMENFQKKRDELVDALKDDADRQAMQQYYHPEIVPQTSTYAEEMDPRRRSELERQSHVQDQGPELPTRKEWQVQPIRPKPFLRVGDLYTDPSFSRHKPGVDYVTNEAGKIVQAVPWTPEEKATDEKRTELYKQMIIDDLSKVKADQRRKEAEQKRDAVAARLQRQLNRNAANLAPIAEEPKKDPTPTSVKVLTPDQERERARLMVEAQADDMNQFLLDYYNRKYAPK